MILKGLIKLKIKLITSIKDATEFEKQLNKEINIIQKNKYNTILDVKYSTSISNNFILFSAIIIYEEVPKESFLN